MMTVSMKTGGWTGSALAHLGAKMGVGRGDDEEPDGDQDAGGVVHADSLAPSPKSAQLIHSAKALRMH
jgi:hypothetical protein